MSILKILSIGDPHFKSDNSLETDLMVSRIKDLIDVENPNIIVVLGDTLHYHERIPMYTLHRATLFIKMLSDTNRNVYILIGNHDRPNNNIFLTDEHAFNSFKEWKNITIIDDVTVVSEIANDNNYYNLLLVPYVPLGRFNEALLTKSLKHPLNDISIVFCHQEWQGCKINLINESKADVWPLDAPFNCSGHIHDYEKVQSNLIYPGTPIQHSPSDVTNKTVSILNMTFKSQGILSFMNERRISLNIPHKISITLTPEKLLDFVLPELFSSIRIRIECSSSTYKGLMELNEIKKLQNIFGVKIIHINIDLFKLSKSSYMSLEENVMISYDKRLGLAISNYSENINKIHKYFLSLPH